MARVTVLGCGHGAHAVAGFLALKGNKVTIVGADPVDADRVSAIRKRGGVELEGVVKGFGRIEEATLSVETGVRDRKYVFIVAPAFAHEYFLPKLANVLDASQRIVIIPDNWGSLRLLKMLKEMRKSPPVLIGGTASLPYACRLSGPARVNVFGVKDSGTVPLAAIPSLKTHELVSELKEIFYEFTGAKNILEVVLNNINFPIHPVVTLLNLGRAEYTKGDFDFYGEGVTPSVAKIMEVVDTERRAVGRMLGLELPSLYELVSSMYKSSGLKGKDLYELLSTSPVHTRTKGPGDLHHRYVAEDVPYGLVPIASLCEHLGVSCPTIKAIIHLYSVALGRDLMAEGVNVEKLGWEKAGREEIIETIEKGFSQ
jgi:opine dehydrogenase